MAVGHLRPQRGRAQPGRVPHPLVVCQRLPCIGKPLEPVKTLKALGPSSKRHQHMPPPRLPALCITASHPAKSTTKALRVWRRSQDDTTALASPPVLARTTRTCTPTECLTPSHSKRHMMVQLQLLRGPRVRSSLFYTRLRGMAGGGTCWGCPLAASRSPTSRRRSP